MQGRNNSKQGLVWQLIESNKFSNFTQLDKTLTLLLRKDAFAPKEGRFSDPCFSTCPARNRHAEQNLNVTACRCDASKTVNTNRFDNFLVQR